MNFTYRGVNYKPNPPALELTEGKIGGKYQGANWKDHYPRHIPVPQPQVDLKYRGVAYCTGDPIDVEAIRLQRRHTSAAASATKSATPTVSSRQKVMDELSDTHLANIRQNLEHRLQVAKAKGDQNLIRLLEAEAEQLYSYQ